MDEGKRRGEEQRGWRKKEDERLRKICGGETVTGGREEKDEGKSGRGGQEVRRKDSRKRRQKRG